MELVPIKLDKTRFLRFGHRGLKMITTLTGKTIHELDFDNIDFDDIEKLVYCGLLTDMKINGDISLEEMEHLLDEVDSYSDIIEALGKAMRNAFGDNGQGDKEKN